jgi:thiol-disulfide isomerase/thioredoxin
MTGNFFGAGTTLSRIRVDWRGGPAQYGFVVMSRFAPEVRGTLRLKIQRLQAVAALCCAGAVFCLAMLPLQATAAELRRWTAGAQPIFSLPNTTGADVALEAARGHVVLVHFFATWCEPCREELPALNRLAARAGGNVKVLAIAVADADRGVQRFFETTPVDFPVLLDRDRAVAKAWQVATLPTTFVLDVSLQPRLVVESDYAWDAIDPGKLAGLSALDAGGSIKDASNR